MMRAARAAVVSIHHDPRAVARNLDGIVINGGRNVLARGPNDGPKERSLRVTFNPDVYGGLSVTSYAGDDWQLCKDFVLEKLGLPKWKPSDSQTEIGTSVGRMIERQRKAETLKRKAEADADQAQRQALALRIWSESSDPRGTLVEKYLREHRGLRLSDDVAGRVLRFHGSLQSEGFLYPAMVALMRDIVTDEPRAIHRTFLNRKTAAKIERKMLGPARDTAIKLDAFADEIAIGEGIETTLAARQLGYEPAWAVGSCVSIAKFPVLREIKKLRLLQENDANQANPKAVEECGRRYLQSGKLVSIILPLVGKDMNDALRVGQ